MPSITPAQRVFGIGINPIEKMFRPPEGMEYDPAYNDFGRETWAKEDMKDAQREAVLAQTELARAQREQLKADRATRGVEDAAIAAMKERPDEIPNILRSFPELARSKNLGGVLNYAQAVQPSAGQKTLAPSLRNRLKPHERQYFDEHFGQNGDAVSAFDAAQLRGEHESGLVDMMKGGVPLDVIDKYRERPLSPLEREAIIQQHSVKHGGEKDAFREQKLKGLLTTLESEVPTMNSDPTKGNIVTLQDVLNKQAANYDMAHRIVYPEKYQQPPAVATPAAEGGKVAPASQLKEVLGGGVTATPKQVQAEIETEINAPDANEDFLTALIENHNVPITQRQKALDKLRNFLTNPSTKPGSTLGDVLARKEKIAEQVARAEKAIKLAPEREKYIQAWSEAKKDTAKDIARFAKSIGVDDAAVINSLAKNEIVEIPGKFNPETEDFKWNVRDLFYDDMAKRLGVNARKIPSLPNEKLEPFQKSEFAKELGVESFTLPGLRRIELGSGKKTYDDVLNAYLQEKAGKATAKEVGLPRPSSPEEALKLPPGTKFLDPNGNIKTVPALQ